MSGINFSSTFGYYTEIRFDYLQKLIIQDCNFQGIGIYIYSATNATFLRCAFSDYYYNDYQGALGISRSSTVSVIQSNFTNNTGAIRLRSCYSHYAPTNLIV